MSFGATPETPTDPFDAYPTRRGRIGVADRAGGPSDLSRQGVSAKGAHPLRGAGSFIDVSCNRRPE